VKKWFLLVFVFALLVSLTTQLSFFQKEKNWLKFSPVDEPLVGDLSVDQLTAHSWVVVDLASGSLLVGKNPNIAFPFASLTKIVTALVAYGHFDLDEVLVIDKPYWVGRHMGLVVGEKVKVIDLLAGLLIHSANDAAYALAENYPGGQKAFVLQMNNWVGKQGLERTHFVNFSGEKDSNHYSTAYDLAQLARIFWQTPIFRQLVELEEKVVYSVDGFREHRLQTTNELLKIAPEARGLKTGWTQQAGECFVGLFEIFPKDKQKSHSARQVVTVVLGSQNRFEETLKILDWVKNNVAWEDHSATHSIEIAGTKAKKL